MSILAVICADKRSYKGTSHSVDPGGVGTTKMLSKQDRLNHGECSSQCTVNNNKIQYNFEEEIATGISDNFHKGGHIV